MANLYQFTLELDAWPGVAEQEFVDFERNLALFAIGSLVRRTPVDTGRARNAWQLGVGTKPTGEAIVGVTAMAQLSLATLRSPVPIWIVNTVPYIQRLEDGWSKQAIDGMLAPTIIELQAKVAAARSGR